MKLTNQQVKVLAEDILVGLQEKANEYKQSSEYINFEDTLKGDSKYKGFNKLNAAIDIAIAEGLIDDCYNARTLKSRKEDYVSLLKSRTFPKAKLPSQQAIENKIILNTIEVDNLDDLITKVKESFNK